MEFPIEAICSLGVGGVFGIVVFIIYRRDRKSSENQQREDRKFMEDRMNQIIERDQATREAHTKAVTELVTLLQRLNGRIR
jgi:hypothetical protein